MPTSPRGNSPAPPPRRTDARINRDRLVATAQEVFAELGPAASLNQIAQRAGVGPGTLYRHFPNRQALLAAVLRDRIERLVRQADVLTATEPPDDALAHWLRALLAHARLNQGMGSTLMVEEPGAPGLDCHRLILDAAAGVLTRAQEHGTARADLAAADLIPLVAGIALSTTHTADPTQPARLLDLVLDATFTTPR
ncbi:TetR/AcrR family transcriptional regulator [Streptomyces venezuelae]|uniref:TetR/AcrR family transcriptional regulator n=1 Tax=Streptomyces venezuelae TaxID=54571 RepID=UPI0012390474|nr:TetR/AcrR family transcriptional regulator [Streptomyces venezuelae]QES10323.1 TetR/AcrR family transcriptional regulator [Streptomyces venezuelae]